MRTTLTIDDGIAAQLREIAHRSGRSLDAVVNEALRAGIANNRIATCPQPYRLEPVALGPVVGACDLDKALQLADRLEDEELARKLQVRMTGGGGSNGRPDGAASRPSLQ